MTRPQRLARMCGNTSCVIRTRPNTFVSNWRRQASSGIDSRGPISAYPALLTRMSMPPVASIAAVIEASSVTSSDAVRQPLIPASASGRRAVAQVSWPALASASAVARPMPVEQPVTSAVLFIARTLLTGSAVGVGSGFSRSRRAVMSWSLSGRYFENCSCDVVCPCTASLSLGADYERCQVVLVFHVDEGEIEGVDVSGLTVAAIGDTPKVMTDGNWRLGVLMDDKA